MQIGKVALRYPMLALFAVCAAMSAGCHGHGAYAPLNEQKIYVSDKFYDLAIRGDKEALVVGYAGKILRTKDFGFTWEQIESGTSDALYNIDFAKDDPQTGWIVGQEGLILKTTDGGSTWTKQDAQAWMGDDCRDDSYRSRNEEKCSQAYLFSVSVVDHNTVVAIGDRSTFVYSSDGGRTWRVSTVKSAAQLANANDEFAIVFEDPVLYDLTFSDANTGFVVGEFGKIFKTTDAGKTWKEKQDSLIGAEIVDPLDLPTLFDVSFDGKGDAMAVGLDGRIAVSSDKGDTWKFTPNNVADFTDPMYAATYLPNGTRWVVGAAGQVVTAQPGQGFQRGSLGSAINSWIRRIRFSDDQHGWLVGGFGLIMNTDDGGKTWYRRIG